MWAPLLLLVPAASALAGAVGLGTEAGAEPPAGVPAAMPLYVWNQVVRCRLYERGKLCQGSRTPLCDHAVRPLKSPGNMLLGYSQKMADRNGLESATGLGPTVTLWAAQDEH